MQSIRSWLYAPGNNAKLLQKVFTAGADAVILDLEDAVPLGEKPRAREMVAAAISPRSAGPKLFVRINHPSSELAQADVQAVARAGLDGLRIPKVEDVATVKQVVTWLERAGSNAVIVCNVESARGIQNAAAIAGAHSRVMALAFGAVDFCRDIGAELHADGVATLYARSQLVIASRAAGIQPPIDSVYTTLDDDAGLRKLAEQSRALGFFGKGAIHPRQVPIINDVFTPTTEAIEKAREIVTAAKAQGDGAGRTAGGDFIDVAVVRRAEDVLRLAGALGA